jgi:hypothetical protein
MPRPELTIRHMIESEQQPNNKQFNLLSCVDRLGAALLKMECIAELLENQEGDPNCDIVHRGVGMLLHDFAEVIRGVHDDIDNDQFEKVQQREKQVSAADRDDESN